MSIYDYDYEFVLKVDDLRGMEHELRIVKVFPHPVWNPEKQRKEKKIALRFENRKKYMILNATQAAKMEHIFETDDEQKWTGRTITLAPMIAFNGKKTINVLAQPSGAAALFGRVQTKAQVKA